MDIYVFDRDPNISKGRPIKTFNNLDLDIMFNSVGSTFSLDFFLDMSNPEHRIVSDMTRHQLIKIEETINGVPFRVFTGFIVKIEKKRKAESTYVKVSGYSIPAVLCESQVPVSTYPRQHDGLTLRQIVERILKPFDIKLVVDDSVKNEVDKAYDSTSCSISETAMSYIESLCKQRDILVTHTFGGRMLLTKANPNAVPFMHVDFTYPIYEGELIWDGSGIHSRINVVGEQSEKTTTTRDAEIFTELVPKWTEKFNPKVVEQSSGDDNDTIKVAKQIRAAELRSIKLKLESASWFVNNQMILPNTTITIQDEELGLYKRSTWFIESVSYKLNEKESTCTINCVLPEVYNGNDPINIFV